jgi:hypothetical protein
MWSFGCIWTALLIYSVSETSVMKNLQPAWPIVSGRVR